jgi:ATP-dependent helicase HepA
MWKPGDRLTHRLNPGLGPGRVTAVSGRSLTVLFPDSGETLTLAAGDSAVVPLILAPGARARLEGTGETVVVAALLGGPARLVRLDDGREVPAEQLWPLPAEPSPLERLERGSVDSFEDFANRLDGLRLSRLREAEGLGSFLGGRIRLFPHQLYAAERACASNPVRWLLADEVGLGKTVEACLILNRLVHTGRAGRVLVVAPETLTVQWLGELWRKHHQVFVLLDDKRLEDVARDHGTNFNPFDVHRQVILGLETLIARRRLTEQAVEAGIDLLVVDEAHHLKRPPGHPGNPAYRAVAPIAGLARNTLLLTATPLEDDAHGFFRLVELLRPEEFLEESFEERLARRVPLPPCTSATRRSDIGGLPPRIGFPVELAGGEHSEGWDALLRLEERVRALPIADTEPARQRKAEIVERALASPATLTGLLDRKDPETAATMALAVAADRADPRLAWLAEQAAAWAKLKEKTLVFVAHRESLERIKDELERRALSRVALFHEGLSPERRDIEVAQFRAPDGPSLLLSTEAGGEGRNFEFCRRLILFDLPWSPGVVEQRIGRLDRIGRTRPTEIVYFRPPRGLGRAVVGLYEEIGLFREPMGGLERELRHVARAIAEAALAGPGEVDPEVFAGVLAETDEARSRVQQAAYHELHRDPYRPEMAPAILARVPPDLEILSESVVLRAASRFGFEIEPQIGGRTWIIELGAESLIDHLPGVPIGSRFLGTFDRVQAVEDEGRDFFASGHPLVEGILAELADGPRGRVALLQLTGDEEVFGLLAIYRRGPGWEALAVDAQGRPRPDLAAQFAAIGLAPEFVEAKKWTGQGAWRKTIHRMAAALPQGEEPEALAAFRVRRRPV